MKYRIAHFYGLKPPVPEAVEIKSESSFEVEIDDLNKFIEEHGPVILSPPSHTPLKGQWFIWVTDKTGRFSQR